MLTKNLYVLYIKGAVSFILSVSPQKEAQQVSFIMTTSSSYVNDACEYFSKHFKKTKRFSCTRVTGLGSLLTHKIISAFNYVNVRQST